MTSLSSSIYQHNVFYSMIDLHKLNNHIATCTSVLFSREDKHATGNNNLLLLDMYVPTDL